MKNTNNNSSQKSKNGQTQNLGYKFHITVDYDKYKESFYPTRKTKIWPNLVRKVWKSCYVKVIYGKDLYNHGTFTTITDVKQFVNECTEPELLNHVKGGIWKSST